MPPPIRHSRLVLVSPHTNSHTALRSILRSECWQVNGFFTGREGLAFLRKHHDVAVVICEDRLPDGEWHQFMSQLTPSTIRPSFIVSAHLGDERLWAEALTLGAFDLLLSAPFEAEEVVRVTESAWLAWNWACGRSPGVEHRPERIELKSRAAGCA